MGTLYVLPPRPLPPFSQVKHVRCLGDLRTEYTQTYGKGLNELPVCGGC